MKILIVNGSPRGRFSVTLQSCLYLQGRFPRHSFEYLNAGAGIAEFERDMAPAAAAFARAELVIFAYPVYSFLVPAQLHRFVERMKEAALPLGGKYVTQLSTSFHFYDMTAHRFLEENFHDLGMRVIHGLSAHREDLLTERGQRAAERFLEYAVYCAENGVYEQAPPRPDAGERAPYVCTLADCEKRDGFDTVIVADLREGDESLRALIRDFSAAYPFRTRFVNLADFPFRGGCLGCLSCVGDGRCVYRDGFDSFLREKIGGADAVVYAFTLRDHSMGARFKMYDDRQFCGGRRPVTAGKPLACLVNGDMSREDNLRTVLEARAAVCGSFLAGFAADAEGIRALAARLVWALEHRCVPPRSFYGVGGGKLLRDHVWLMQGILREAHLDHKARGLYDFPQRRWPRMLGLRVLSALLRSRRMRSIIGDKLNAGLLAPYKKITDKRTPL